MKAIPSRDSIRDVSIPAGAVTLEAILGVPQRACGVVLFAHGSGSSRLSPRNGYVARQLRKAGLATVLLDLLSTTEERIDSATGQLRFDIPLLTERLRGATQWAGAEPELRHLRIGYFGASTGAAAALAAAARIPEVAAVVSRGGRPDLAGTALEAVRAATLLIVGGEDGQVLRLNRQALERLRCAATLEIVPGATHLFEEPGALERVASLAADWFVRYLGDAATRTAGASEGAP
jgi:dienelactone hydrolase